MKINRVLISLLVVPVFAFAQAGLPAEGLPNAGLTPESPFYFFDKLGETLREFFTFNPEGKARLQITFAAERVAEIKVILETRGVEAMGLAVAQARLKEHLGDVAKIVIKQKGKGKDVSKLAKELVNEFEKPKLALAESFKAEKRAFKAKEDELKAQLKAAKRAGDTAKAETVAQELGQVKAQLELLELKGEDIEDELEAEEEKIEEELEAQEKAEKAIREAEKEKQKVLDEAAEEDIAVPAGIFGKFDSLLAQAKVALAAGNFQEAERLAKQTKKNLDFVEEAIEDLEDAKEKGEELKGEQEEKEREAKEEQEETVKEEAEKEAERLEKEQEKAEEDTREAEEKLREAGNEDED